MEHRKMEREDIFRMIEGGKSHGTEVSENMPDDRVYTIKDIEALPEGERAELIDGKMYRMATPTLTHQDMLMWMSVKIWMHISEHGGGCKVLPAPFAVYIRNDDHNYVEPDISVICDRDKLDEKGCHGAPDWVVEIVSQSSKPRDLVRRWIISENVRCTNRRA